MAVNAKAAAMRALGRDILSLAAGEPDFDTPSHIKKLRRSRLKTGQQNTQRWMVHLNSNRQSSINCPEKITYTTHLSRSSDRLAANIVFII